MDAIQTATVSTGPATCYTVRNGWAWAHIFVRHGETLDRPAAEPRRWVHLSVVSDFGEFGYCWTHIGPDWRDFLRNLDFDYAMLKLLGPRLSVPITATEAAEKARALVVQYRREGNLDASDARDLYDAASDVADAHDCRDFLRQWDGLSGGLMYRYDLYDAKWDRPNPQAVGFWSEIWPHFIVALNAEPASQSGSEATDRREASPAFRDDLNPLHNQAGGSET